MSHRFALIGLCAFIVVACGGATTPPEDAPAPAGQQDPAQQEAVPGGGRMTEVHPGFGGSPHVRAEWMLDDAAVSITYGRPYLRGRVVGEGVEPMEGQVWRLGADEATTLSSDRPLTIGGTTVPAGEHTLWVLDTGETWQLIVNRQTGQMGTDYDESQDLARIPMTVTRTDTTTEQLTIGIEGGELVIEWGDARASVPVEVGNAEAA